MNDEIESLIAAVQSERTRVRRNEA